MTIYVFGTRGFPGIQGGVEKHCEELYSAMSENVKIVVFRRIPYLKESSFRRTEKHITFIDLFSTKIKGVEPFIHSFLSALYCIFKRPDIVHVHNIGPGLFIPLLKIVGLKVVLTYHSPNYEHKKWNWFGKTILKIGECFATTGANAIIFVNSFQQSKFPLIIQQKSAFIPNGIQCQQKLLNTDYLSKHALSPRKYLLAVGRLTQEKGFDYLIDAFLHAKVDGYKLVIAGGVDHRSSYSDQLLRKAFDNGIIMTGYVEGEELGQLYSHARLFILPSFNEGFPMVLLEALNYELDILISDILPNKNIGLPENSYFQVGNVKILSERIKAKLNEMHHYSPSVDLSLYQWDNIAQRTTNLYIKVKNHK